MAHQGHTAKLHHIVRAATVIRTAVGYWLRHECTQRNAGCIATVNLWTTDWLGSEVCRQGRCCIDCIRYKLSVAPCLQVRHLASEGLSGLRNGNECNNNEIEGHRFNKLLAAEHIRSRRNRWHTYLGCCRLRGPAGGNLAPYIDAVIWLYIMHVAELAFNDEHICWAHIVMGYRHWMRLFRSVVTYVSCQFIKGWHRSA